MIAIQTLYHILQDKEKPTDTMINFEPITARLVGASINHSTACLTRSCDIIMCMQAVLLYYETPYEVCFFTVNE